MIYGLPTRLQKPLGTGDFVNAIGLPVASTAERACQLRVVLDEKKRLAKSLFTIL